MRIRALFFCQVFLPVIAHASFIEASMGTAVVNDATATYHNPAALTLLNNTQFVALGSYAKSQNTFSGETTQARTGFTQTGSANTKSHFHLPSFYWAKPATENLRIGIGLISNFFNNDLEEPSILRYAKSNNSVQNIDLITSLAYQFNHYLSLGAGLGFSYANFTQEPVFGFPSLEIADTQSTNVCDSSSISGNIGILLKPGISTLIGLNYRNSATYHFRGNSFLASHPALNSSHYRYTFWTPARTVLTISQAFSKSAIAFVTTQYIQWNIIDTVNIQEAAAQIGARSMIINTNLPFHLRNSWIVTLGGQINPASKWTLRAAASYIESPGNGNYQLANGNSIVLGASAAYELCKHIQVDGSYAHAFTQNESISIASIANTVNGRNKSSRDSVSLKLTYTV